MNMFGPDRFGQEVTMAEIEIEKVKKLVRDTRPFFVSHGKIDIKEKGTADFVTQIDIMVQETVQTGLRELYPDIQFMGEEKDNSDIDFKKPVWILDPIDGTTNFIHGYCHSTLSLALCADKRIVMGIVYQPYTEELFWAQEGKGAWLNEERIFVSGTEELEKSLVTVGTSPWKHELADKNFEIFKQIFLRCSDIRRTGSAALDLAYVACGRTEAFVEHDLKPWDFAAGILLVKEAKGTVTDYRGREIDITAPSQIAAGNGYIGELLVKEILKDY